MVSTHLKNICQNWIISAGRGENKEYLKPPTSICIEIKKRDFMIFQTMFTHDDVDRINKVIPEILVIVARSSKKLFTAITPDSLLITVTCFLWL